MARLRYFGHSKPEKVPRLGLSWTASVTGSHLFSSKAAFRLGLLRPWRIRFMVKVPRQKN